jgi:SWI/SNF-related matrix-associated actin-dependent regulator 1 of chromatin subfamily A
VPGESELGVERQGADAFGACSKDEVDAGWDVLITTYQLAQGAELDRKFLAKSVKWEVSAIYLVVIALALIGICSVDVRVRRRPRAEELPEPALPTADEDPGTVEAVVDGHAVAKQFARVGGKYVDHLKPPHGTHYVLLQSLISFILPGKFTAETTDSLRTIFKVRADSHASLLSRERVSRAKTMMTPFVLRRRKDQVRHTIFGGLHELTRVGRC